MIDKKMLLERVLRECKSRVAEQNRMARRSRGDGEDREMFGRQGRGDRKGNGRVV